MALVYDLVRFAESGVKAMQGAQRDWSPNLVHFTQALSMQSIKMLFDDHVTEPERVKQCLEHADQESYVIAAEIIKKGMLLASPIYEKSVNRSVCFSECTLPGIIGHSERYGRFGFVFKKNDVYNAGGRPCVYVDDEVNRKVKEDKDANEVAARLWCLTNVFRPVGKIQDYTHEREWRIFNNFPLKKYLRAVIAPDHYAEGIHSLLKDQNLNVPVLPIDMLYDWGV